LGRALQVEFKVTGTVYGTDFVGRYPIQTSIEQSAKQF